MPRPWRLAAAWRAAPFLFGSGFCALVYQVAWQREFRLVFGASTAASAAVMAIFMGSLGAGGWALGRVADRRRDPWMLYSRLEVLVALTAALTPPLLWAARAIYLGLGGSIVLGDLAGTLLRLALASLVLLPPMFLAGGTLPAAARAVQREDDRGRRGLAVLYGVNTLGAVAGAVAATFALLEMFGTRGTLWLACLLNLGVAIAARAVSFARTDPAAAAFPVEADRPALRAPLVFSAAAAVGFAFFLMELVWYRMLGPILGGSVYTFGLVLAVALAGIGIGGLLYSVAGSRRSPTAGAFALTCVAEAVCIAVPFVLGDRIAALALRWRPTDPQGLADYTTGWTAVASIVILPAAIVAGAQFPLLVGLLGRGREAVGRHLGQAYAWNTVGAIGGALAGGFGFLPLLSAPGCWRAVAIGLALLGLGAAVAGRAHRLTALACLAGTGAITAAVLGAPGPTAAWRHSGIGAGRADIRDLSAPNALRAWTHAERRSIAWEAEGVESSVAVQRKAALAFVVNGKIDGNARHDAPTQVMSGLLGALLHPSPRSALVVGLGTGTTAGWLGSVPSITRTDVVELEPVIRDVARDCAPVNRRVLENPRVHVRIADAREVLMTTRARYDLIFSEPSNPYRAGLASFFTREFYVASAARLAEGGLFLQWMQAYEVDDHTVDTVLATLASVFGFVEIWQTQGHDLLLVASVAPRTLDLAQFSGRAREEPFRTALRVAWRAETIEAVLARFVAGADVARATLRRGVSPNTDDRNGVEFGFARTVGRGFLFRLERLRAAAARIGADRPVMAGSVDWSRVQHERVSVSSIHDEAPPIEPSASMDVRARAVAHGLYLRGERAAAARAFAAQGRPPAGAFETVLVAEGLAESGDTAALPLIEAAAAEHPLHGDVLRARLLVRQGRLEDALQALERALVAYRSDPWPVPRIMAGALSLAEEIAGRRPELAPRVFAALDAPFSVHVLDIDRLGSVLRVAQYLPAEPYCRRALEPLEPFVPWSAEALLYRRNCYETTGDPRAAAAAADFAEFVRSERHRIVR